MSAQRPSIGRIVHYTSHGTPGGEYTPQCRAAIVTEVDEYQPNPGGRFLGHVGLCVLNPTGMFFNQSVRQDEPGDHDPASGEGPRGGTWHWPERED